MDLRSARKKKGLTQNELCRELSKKAKQPILCSQKTISYWECGKGIPSESEIKALCEVLGLSENALEFGQGKATDFWEILEAGGAGKDDIDLIQRNPVLHEPLAKVVKEFCMKIRKDIQP